MQNMDKRNYKQNKSNDFKPHELDKKFLEKKVEYEIFIQLNETSAMVWLYNTDSPMLEKYALELKLKENTT